MRIVNYLITKYLSEGADKAAADVDKVTTANTRLGNSSTSSGRKFAEQSKGLGGLVAIYAGAAANVFALSAAFEALSRAAITSQTLSGLNALAAASGTTSKSVISSIKNITSGQLSLATTAEVANLALSAGLGDSMNGLIEVGSKASRALGRDLTDSINRIIRGTTKLEPELLDELGIFVRLDTAVEKYATTIGKTATQLTEFERRQAFANAVTAEGNLKFKDINTFTDTSATSLARLQASISDLTTQISSLIATALTPLANFFSGSLGNQLLLLVGIASVVFGKLKTIVSEFVSTTLKDVKKGIEQKYLSINKSSAEAVTKSAEESAKALKSFSGVGAFRLGGKAAAEDMKLIKSTLASMAAGEVQTVAQINAATEANKRLIEARQTAIATQKLDTDTKNRYKDQIKSLTNSEKAFGNAAQEVTDKQQALQNRLNMTSSAISGLVNVGSKLLTWLGGVGIAIGAIQLIGDIFGADIIGGVTGFIQKVFGATEAAKNFSIGMGDLAASFVNASNVFKLPSDDLKKLQDELSNTFTKITSIKSQVIAGIGGPTLVSEQEFGMRQQMTINRTTGQSPIKPLTGIENETVRITELNKEIERYSVNLAKGGVEAAKASIAIKVLNDYINMLRLGGIGAANAITQFSAVTGLATGQLAKLITAGNFKKLSDDGREVALVIGNTELKITNAEGAVIEFGANISAMLAANQAAFMIFNEEFSRGALNAEAASRSLAGMRTRYAEINTEITTIIMNSKSISEADAKRLQDMRNINTQFKAQIDSTNQLVNGLQMAESYVKAIQEAYPASNAPKMIISGQIGTVGNEVKLADTPEQQRIFAAQNLQRLLSGINDQEIIANNIKIQGLQIEAKLIEDSKKIQLDGLEQLKIQRDKLIEIQKTEFSFSEASVNAKKEEARISSIITQREATILQYEQDRAQVNKEITQAQNSQAAIQGQMAQAYARGALNNMQKQFVAATEFQRELGNKVGAQRVETENQIREYLIGNNALLNKQTQNQITLANERLNLTIREKELQLSINQLKIQAAQQALQAQKDLNTAILEQYTLQSKIAGTREQIAAAELQRSGQAQLGVLQEQLAAQQAFPNLSAQEDILRTREAIAKQEYNLQMMALEAKKQEAIRDTNEKLRANQTTIDNLKIDQQLVQLKGAAAKAEYDTQKAILEEKRKTEDDNNKKRIDMLEREKKNVELTYQIAIKKADQADKERNDQLDLLSAKMEASNKEIEANKQILISRQKLVEAEIKLWAEQLKYQGLVDEAGNLLKKDGTDTLLFFSKLNESLNQINTQSTGFIETLRNQSRTLTAGEKALADQRKESSLADIALQQELITINKERQATIRKLEDDELKAKLDAAGAGAKIELETLALRIRNGEDAKTLINEELRLRMVNFGIEEDGIKRLLAEKLNAIQRERDQVRILFNAIAGVINNSLNKAVDDLFEAMKNGTLTMETFKQGLKDLFRNLAFDIQKEIFKEMTLKPITEWVKSSMGSLADWTVKLMGGKTEKEQGLESIAANIEQTTGMQAKAAQDLLTNQITSNKAAEALYGKPQSVIIAGQVGVVNVAVTSGTAPLGGVTPPGAERLPTPPIPPDPNFIGPPLPEGGIDALDSSAEKAATSTGLLSGAFGSLGQGVTGLLGQLGPFGAIIGIVGKGLLSLLSFFGQALSSVISSIAGASAGGGGGFLGSIFGSLFGGGSIVEKGIEKGGGFFDPSGAAMMGSAEGGLVRKMAAGGGVSLRDRVPALLEPGEFVVRKPAVDNAGLPAMQRLNATGSTAPPPVKIDIQNQGTQKDAEQQGTPMFDGEAWVVKLILKDLRSNGPIRRGMRSGLG